MNRMFKNGVKMKIKMEDQRLLDLTAKLLKAEIPREQVHRDRDGYLNVPDKYRDHVPHCVAEAKRIINQKTENVDM